MATPYSQFENDCPREVREMIMGHIALTDTIVVTRKAMHGYPADPQDGPLRYVSYFMAAFSSRSTFAEYRSVLRKCMTKEKQVVKVVMEDYDFTNIKGMMKHLVDKDGTNVLGRFCFTSRSIRPFNNQDLVGPYISLNLRFTPAFHRNDGSKLFSYLTCIKGLQKRLGGDHLRIFYNIAKADSSQALDELLAGLLFDETAQGQMEFLMAALQKRFAPDLATMQQGLPGKGQGQVDINRGFVRN